MEQWESYLAGELGDKQSRSQPRETSRPYPRPSHGRIVEAIGHGRAHGDLSTMHPSFTG